MSEFTRLVITWGWLVLTAIGVGMTALIMWLTKSDLVFLKEHGINGSVTAATRLAFGNSMRAFVILFLLFLVGLISLFAPHVPSTRQQPGSGPYNWGFIIFLYLVVVLLDYSTFALYRFRKRWLTGRTTFEAS